MSNDQSAQSAQSVLVDRVTTAVVSQWLQHEKYETSAVIPHLTRALPALGQLNGRMKNLPLLEWLGTGFHDASRDVRSGVIEALGYIGEVATRDVTVLSNLVQALRDRDALVRVQAAEALRKIGKAAARHPEVLPVLVQTALYDTDWFVRSGATRAWGR